MTGLSKLRLRLSATLLRKVPNLPVWLTISNISHKLDFYVFSVKVEIGRSARRASTTSLSLPAPLSNLHAPMANPCCVLAVHLVPTRQSKTYVPGDVLELEEPRRLLPPCMPTHSKACMPHRPRPPLAAQPGNIPTATTCTRTSLRCHSFTFSELSETRNTGAPSGNTHALARWYN